LSKDGFDKLLLEAIEECLDSLDEPSKLAIYFCLQETFNIRKEDILENAKVFSRALEEIFGLGGNYLETLIPRSLCQKTGWIDKDALKQVDFSQALWSVKKELEC
jgi:hypothetical protein